MKKSQILQIILWVGLVLLLGIFASRLTRIQPKASSPTPESLSPETEADLKIDRFQLTESDKGKVLWRLEADSARLFEEAKETRLEGIHLLMYQEERPALDVSGNNGLLNMDTHNISLAGGVRACSPEGLCLTTESLRWMQHERELSTNDPVRIERPNLKIEGRGLVANLDLERIRILGRVTTRIN